MTTGSSAPRKVFARIEALESRSLFSGEIDHSFGLEGRLPVTTAAGAENIYTPDIAAKAIALQPDGKMLVAGRMPGSSTTAVVVRYTASGVVDKSFGTNGYATVKNVKAGNIDNISVLSNGKILVAGQSYFRLTSAGKLDTTYGGGDGIAPSLLAGDKRAFQPDVIAADGSVFELSKFIANGQDRVFKYKADGSVDKSFGSGGSVSLAAYAPVDPNESDNTLYTGGVALDASGRVYVSLSRSDGVRVVRLTAAGKLDATWGKNGIARGNSEAPFVSGAIGVLSDGRVLVNYTGGINGMDVANSLDVFDAKGVYKGRRVVEPPVTNGGYRSFSFSSIRQAKDGSIYLGGDLRLMRPGAGSSVDDYDQFFAAVMHLKSDLSLDTGYSADLDGVGGFATGGITRFAGVALDGSGRPVLLGRDGFGNDGGGFVARLTAAGTANRVTYKASAGNKLTVTGSSGADVIGLRSFRYEGDAEDADYGIFLDNTFNAMSPDVLFYNSGEVSVPLLTVNLGAGNDYLDGQSWNLATTANGGSGDDAITLGSDFELNAAAMVVNGDDGNDGITTGRGNDTIHGGKGNDHLAGIWGDDKLYGDDGNDELISGPGADSLYGGAGDDHLDVLSGSKALADGGSGFDTALYDDDDVYTFISIEKKTAV